MTTRFEPETRFEVAPVPAVPFRGTQETELDRLKARLLRELLQQTPDEQFYAPLRRAANEAAALAWFTPFPLLFFPGLLEEKARAALRQGAHRQRAAVRDRSEKPAGERPAAMTARGRRFRFSFEAWDTNPIHG